MSQFYQREYLDDDLRRWFEGSVIYSHGEGVAGTVQELSIEEGVVNFLLHNPFHLDDPWWDDDVETSFESYGAVQCGNVALFFSRMPNRQYSFGIKQRQFVIEHLPGMGIREPVDMLVAVTQFYNRTTYSMQRALQLLSEGEKRSCVLSEDVRMMRVYRRDSREPVYMLVWRGNIVGFVGDERQLIIEDQYEPFQHLIMQDVAA